MTEKEDEFPFYANGIFYKTEEDFLRATEQLAESPASENTCYEIMSTLSRAIHMNLKIYRLKIPNATLSNLLHDAVYEVIGELVNKRETNEPRQSD